MIDLQFYSVVFHYYMIATRQCVSPGTLVFSTNKTDCHDISEILLKVAFFLYPRSPKGEGGILFYLCPSFRPSKIFFVAFL